MNKFMSNSIAIKQKKLAIKKEKKIKNSVGKIILYVCLVILAIITFSPFLYMISNATHSTYDITTKFNLIPGRELLNNLRRAEANSHVLNGFKNSLIIAVSSTIVGSYIGALTSFGFSKYKFKGNNILFCIVIGSMMFPPQLGLVGFYQVCNKLGILDTHLAMILPNIAVANLVFFVKMYMDSAIPTSIIESARIDGCSEFGIFNKIVLPLSLPSISAMAILLFINVWNNLIQASAVLTSEKNYTIPIIIRNVRGVYRNDVGAMYGVIAISIVPIMIMFAIGSKYIIGGLVAGSVKE